MRTSELLDWPQWRKLGGRKQAVVDALIELVSASEYILPDARTRAHDRIRFLAAQAKAREILAGLGVKP